jgi:hypothetical protein
VAACATVTNAPDPTNTAPTAAQGATVITVSGNTAQVFSVEAGARFGLARIRHSADEGTTWRTEYSNFDRAAHEAEQRAKQK